MPDTAAQTPDHPYSFNSPAFIANPFPILNRLREEAPVHYHPDLGSWSISRHDDLVTGVKNHQVYSNAGGNYGSAQRGLGIYGPEVQKRRLSSRDEPSHGALRKLMARSFTPGSMSALVTGVDGIVDQLIEEMRAKSRSPEGAEFVRDFAYPLAVMSMNLILGVPEEIRHLFRDYTGTVDDTVGEYFKRLTRMREESPGDDLTSRLIEAARTGHEYLDSSEVNYMLAGLWTAGNWTTTLLISNAMAFLHELPGMRDELAADSGLVPGFVEESLRCGPPVIITSKTTLSDVEVRGQRIPAGAKVMFCYGAANRDPRIFNEPEKFDIRRAPNPHVSFTEGIHRCLGAPLARMEAVSAFRKLSDPALKLRLDLGRAKKHVAGPFWGYRELPVHID
jgi:cytochrome P450